MTALKSLHKLLLRICSIWANLNTVNVLCTFTSDILSKHGASWAQSQYEYQKKNKKKNTYGQTFVQNEWFFNCNNYRIHCQDFISHFPCNTYMIGPFSESRWQTIQYGLPMVTGRCSVRIYRRYCDLKIHRYSCLMVWYHIMMNTRHFFILFSSVCPLHFKGYYFPFVKRRCDFYHLKYMSVYWLRLKVNIGLLPDCTRLLRGVLYKRFSAGYYTWSSVQLLHTFRLVTLVLIMYQTNMLNVVWQMIICSCFRNEYFIYLGVLCKAIWMYNDITYHCPTAQRSKPQKYATTKQNKTKPNSVHISRNILYIGEYIIWTTSMQLQIIYQYQAPHKMAFSRKFAFSPM